MKGWLGGLRQRSGFIAGFIVASFIFGGYTWAADIVQRDIRVSYLPLRYFFDGVERVPPADQQGFTYNGRTYVPLRFMAESVGKQVAYDAGTFGIYVGRRPELTIPPIWNGFTQTGDASLKHEYYSTGVITVRGEPMPNTVLITTAADKVHAGPDDRTVLAQKLTIPAGATHFSGTLFVPMHYFGEMVDRPLAKMQVMNETNSVVLYESPVLQTQSNPKVAVNIPVKGYQHLWVYMTIYHGSGHPVSEEVISAQLGVSDLGLK